MKKKLNIRLWTSTGFATLVCGLVLTQVACRSVRRSEPVAGPLDLSDTAVQRGQVAFMQQCHMCHPEGEGGLGPSLNDKPLPVWLTKLQVRVGFGSMPYFGTNHIPPERLDDLVAYMKALSRNEPSGAKR